MTAAVFLFWSAAVVLASGAKDTDIVILQTQSGEVEIAVELAATPESRAKGLMFRRHLGKYNGMLFLYDFDHEVQMWMKNTILPLDMIFIRRDGVVHRIEHHTQPFSEQIISSHGPVRAVLELNAGSAAAFNLQPGDKIRHPFFEAHNKAKK